MSTTDCSICCQPFTASRRKPVVCSCQQTTCTQCVQKYLLSRTEDAHCLHCKTTWDKIFLLKYLPKNFINKTYREYRQQVLFEQEQAMMMATQPHVQATLELKRREHEFDAIWNYEKTTWEEFEAQKNELRELQRRVTLMTSEQYAGKPITETPKMAYKCTQTECQGFVVDNICGICDTKMCEHCREPTTENHKCDPDTVKTIQLLTKDTKPCPKCATMIHRTEGCPQMFCTQCHTAFCWNTMAIEVRHIHNPHYFEWIRTQKVQQPDNAEPVDRCTNIDVIFLGNLRGKMRADFYRNGRDKIVEYESQENFINKNFRIYLHVRAACNDFLPAVQNPFYRNLMSRIKFMCNTLSRREFELQLFKEENKRIVDNHLHQLLTMYVDSTADLYRDLYTERITFTDFSMQYNSLVQYCHSQFMNYKEAYNVHDSKYNLVDYFGEIPSLESLLSRVQYS